MIVETVKKVVTHPTVIKGAIVVTKVVAYTAAAVAGNILGSKLMKLSLKKKIESTTDSPAQN